MEKSSLRKSMAVFFDKHFEIFFISLLVILYLLVVAFASFIVGNIFEFYLSPKEEIIWRETATSLWEENKDTKITLNINDADVAVDNDIVYIWRGITKSAIKYDFARENLQASENNFWCILLAIPLFFISELAATLVICGIIFVVVNTKRFVVKSKKNRFTKRY